MLNQHLQGAADMSSNLTDFTASAIFALGKKISSSTDKNILRNYKF